jgi:hypothetical protein
MGPERTSLRAATRVARAGLRVATLVVALLATRAAAEKTDVVVLSNGDHFTGEIKGMSRGQLDFKTDDAGRLSIEWVKIARLTSVHSFEVELASGQKYYGPLESPSDGKILIGREPDTHLFPVTVIVTVTPMDDWFWARVKAYLDLGFTLAKSNKAFTLSGDGQFAYRGQHFGGAIDFNMYVQDDDNSTAVGQVSGTVTGTYYFSKLRAQLQFGVDHNDELDLTIRLDLGTGVAYPLLRDNTMELWLSGGLVGVREVYTSGSPNYNLAGYIGGEWDAFVYDTPKLNAGVAVTILPVLTELWRVRGNVTAKVKYELFYNFFVGLNFSYTFDTEPPDPTASHTDYLLSITIGWSYRR